MSDTSIDTGDRSNADTIQAVRRSRHHRNVGFHVTLTVVGIIWITPILWTFYESLRPKAATDTHGYFSIGGKFSIDNYIEAWTRGGFSDYIVNSIIITVPAVIITLLLASSVAFAAVRFTWRLNVTVLVVLTALNLIPIQVLATPIFKIFAIVPLPHWLSPSGTLLDTYLAVIIMDIAIQMGFCVFVLSSYMSRIPREIALAAAVDGAGVFRRYWSIILPLCKPALGALATLLTVWIYNDFFWPLLLIQNPKMYPAVLGIYNLFGAHFTDYNLVGAGVVFGVLPMIVVFLVFRKSLVGGLTLGSSKG